MNITLEMLKKMNACPEAIDWYKEQKTTDIRELYKKLKAIENSDLKWGNWLITKLLSRDNKIRYAIYAAEQVLPIWEEKYPKDKRPAIAIDAAKEYLELYDAGAAYAAATAADAADVDVYAAYAAYAAADAAADAAAYADVAYAAADAAAYAAAYADVAYAAANAAYAAATAAAAADAADAAGAAYAADAAGDTAGAAAADYAAAYAADAADVDVYAAYAANAAKREMQINILDYGMVLLESEPKLAEDVEILE